MKQTCPLFQHKEENLSQNLLVFLKNMTSSQSSMNLRAVVCLVNARIFSVIKTHYSDMKSLPPFTSAVCSPQPPCLQPQGQGYTLMSEEGG